MRSKKVPMPFIKIKNYKIYYEVHGEGEVIFFMHHGFGCIKYGRTYIPDLWLRVLRW